MKPRAGIAIPRNQWRRRGSVRLVTSRRLHRIGLGRLSKNSHLLSQEEALLRPIEAR